MTMRKAPVEGMTMHRPPSKVAPSAPQSAGEEERLRKKELEFRRILRIQQVW